MLDASNLGRLVGVASWTDHSIGEAESPGSIALGMCELELGVEPSYETFWAYRTRPLEDRPPFGEDVFVFVLQFDTPEVATRIVERARARAGDCEEFRIVRMFYVPRKLSILDPSGQTLLQVSEAAEPPARLCEIYTSAGAWVAHLWLNLAAHKLSEEECRQVAEAAAARLGG